jgi:hypothetical protein
VPCVLGLGGGGAHAILSCGRVVRQTGSRSCSAAVTSIVSNVEQIRTASSGMLRRVALVRTDVTEEHSASIIRVTRIGELGTLAATSNRRTLRSCISSQRASVASCG